MSEIEENWEALAEFTIELKDENHEDIFCLCSRVTIDDKNLLFYNETGSEYSSEFLEGLDNLKDLGVEVSFQKDLCCR